MMTHAWHTRLRTIAVLGVLAYFLASGVRLMHLPGLEDDELLFVDVARGITSAPQTQMLLGIPVMVFPYIGCLKSWLYAPIFALFGVSVTTVRLPAILLAAAALLIGFAVVRRFLRGWSAVLTLGLMATDPTLVFSTTLDYGPVVLMLVLKLLALAALARFLAKPSARSILVAGAATLLGVYDKVNFLWFVFGAAAAMVLVYRARWWRWSLAHPGAWAGAVLFGAAIATVSWYAAAWATPENLPSPDESVSPGAKLAHACQSWVTTFSGRGLLWFIAREHPPLPLPALAWLLPGALGVLVAAATIARRGQSARRRYLASVTLALAVLAAGIFATMVLTPSQLGPHHVMMLWPLHQWLAVLGLVLIAGRLPQALVPRGSIPVVLLAAIGLQVASLESQLHRLEQRRAFADAWDPQVAELTTYVTPWLDHVDQVLCIEWGTATQLRAACPRSAAERVRDVSLVIKSLEGQPAEQRARFHDAVLAGKTTLAVVSAAGARTQPGVRSTFLSLIAEHGCEQRWLKLWPRVGGTPLYGVLSVRCAPSSRGSR